MKQHDIPCSTCDNSRLIKHIEDIGYTKVRQFHNPVVGQEEIARLDVAVNHALRVNVPVCHMGKKRVTATKYTSQGMNTSFSSLLSAKRTTITLGRTRLLREVD